MPKNTSLLLSIKLFYFFILALNLYGFSIVNKCRGERVKRQRRSFFPSHLNPGQVSTTETKGNKHFPSSSNTSSLLNSLGSHSTIAPSLEPIISSAPLKLSMQGIIADQSEGRPKTINSNSSLNSKATNGTDSEKKELSVLNAKFRLWNRKK